MDKPNIETSPHIIYRTFFTTFVLLTLHVTLFADAIYDYTTFDVPGSRRFMGAGGINDLGQVVGSYSDQNFTGHGFLRSADGTTFTTFDPPGSIATSPNGINDLGQVVGYFYTVPPIPAGGFIRSANGGTYTLLKVPGSGLALANARGINNDGIVVGNYGETAGIQGFLRNPDGTYTSFSVPGQIFTLANGINNAGAVVGNTSNGVGDQGFLRSADGMSYVLFSVPGSIKTDAFGINDQGLIVGNYEDAEGFHGFVRSADGSTYVKIDVPGVVGETFVTGINDAGDLVGQYSTPSTSGSDDHIFIATPVASTPEPSSFLTIASAFLLLFMARRFARRPP